MENEPEKTADMREVTAFWMHIVRSDEEKTADRIRASELWARAAQRDESSAEDTLSDADRALLGKVARRLSLGQDKAEGPRGR